jgi:hypothetical protein
MSGEYYTFPVKEGVVMDTLLNLIREVLKTVLPEDRLKLFSEKNLYRNQSQ